ncbi:hypothetical protein V6N11_037394 [Hibiscus sabdariffa]|uniref:Uncharacterized protein n=1 Tax=Hibiscus sabdariffa TaxID=183260 RepID=A0ABR2P1F4_9ROSI
MEISKKGSHGKESGSGNINEILENEKRAETKVLIEAKRVGKAALSVESHSQGVKSWLDSSSSNLCNGGRFSRT